MSLAVSLASCDSDSSIDGNILHSLGLENENEMPLNILGHVSPFALAWNKKNLSAEPKVSWLSNCYLSN